MLVSTLYQVLYDLSSILRLEIRYNKDMKFQERIRELRVQKGLSQMELSKATGLSQSAIAKWELGKTEPTATAIVVLAKFFGETTDYLLGLSE